jgi:hypothetical protein
MASNSARGVIRLLHINCCWCCKNSVKSVNSSENELHEDARYRMLLMIYFSAYVDVNLPVELVKLGDQLIFTEFAI